MTAYIHVPTVFLMLLLGYGLLALLISLSERHTDEVQALRDWNLGSWALVGGFCALVLRSYLPQWISVLGANWLPFLGAVLYSRAIYHFVHGHAAPLQLWVLYAAGCGGSLLLLSEPRSVRAINASIVLLVLLLPGLWQILRLPRLRTHPLRMVGITLTITAIALCLRALHAWKVPQDYDDAMQLSLGQGLSFVLAFVAMLGAGFGFVLAVLERNAERMREMATHDGLTGCVNRITFDALLLNALQRGQRADEPVSLLMMDLDHFKAINDRYGHRAGDAVLRSFAAIVRSKLRASDTLARVGGEEFAVILPGTDAAGAAHVAESVRAAVQSAAVDNQQGGVLRITISVGVACAQGSDAPTADLLYQQADAALYQAKTAGRNRVEPTPTVGAEVSA